MAKGMKAETHEGFVGKGSEGGFVTTPALNLKGGKMKGGKMHRLGQSKSSSHHSMHHRGHK